VNILVALGIPNVMFALIAQDVLTVTMADLAECANRNLLDNLKIIINLGLKRTKFSVSNLKRFLRINGKLRIHIFFTFFKIDLVQKLFSVNELIFLAKIKTVEYISLKLWTLIFVNQTFKKYRLLFIQDSFLT
jgi:hypothetical protein